MLDGWKLELLKFFSIQENRLKTPKSGFFKQRVKKFRAFLKFKTNFETQELRLPPYFEWETKKSADYVPVRKFSRNPS